MRNGRNSHWRSVCLALMLAIATAAGWAQQKPDVVGDYAAVVLYNASPGENGSFFEILGRHVSQRLAGKPAITLGTRE